MAELQTILYTGVIFNLAVVLLVVYLVNRSRDQVKAQALIRSRQILEQGKIISSQERVIKGKQQLLDEKNKLIKEYRKNEG